MVFIENSKIGEKRREEEWREEEWREEEWSGEKRRGCDNNKNITYHDKSNMMKDRYNDDNFCISFHCILFHLIINVLLTFYPYLN